MWEGRLPRRCASCLELTGKRVLFEGPSGRYWYLGERVLRQVKGRVDAALTPVMPPMNMRHTDSLDGDELMEALTGWDAEEFTSPNTDYMTFCNQFLMRPRVIGFPPQGVSLYPILFNYRFMQALLLSKLSIAGPSGSWT